MSTSSRLVGRREQLGDPRADRGLCEPAVELCRILLAEDSHALGISDRDSSCGQDHEHGLRLAAQEAFLVAFGLGGSSVLRRSSTMIGPIFLHDGSSLDAFGAAIVSSEASG